MWPLPWPRRIGSAAWVIRPPEQVGLQLVPQVGLGQFLDRAELSVPGVVHHHVQPAEPLVRPPHGGRPGSAVGHVERDRQHGVPVLGDQISHRRRVSGGGRDLNAPLEGRHRECAPEARDAPVMNHVFVTLFLLRSPRSCRGPRGRRPVGSWEYRTHPGSPGDDEEGVEVGQGRAIFWTGSRRRLRRPTASAPGVQRSGGRGAAPRVTALCAGGRSPERGSGSRGRGSRRARPRSQ